MATEFRDVFEKEAMMGGEGSVHMEQILSAEEMMGKARLFNRVTLRPDCSIGTHTHRGDNECYFILSGTGTYQEDGVEKTVEPGSITYTRDGHSHSLKNTGEEDLVFIALILYS